ncbi:MAG TPA: hypothetical protein ENH11_00090 [Candidatus Acetothermia bacterium]|nr:hypothetical protein [Candidatus Acetothermia bacterium]
MRRSIVVLTIVFVIFSLSVTTFAQETDENLSNGRSFGIGMQVGFPWGGLVSCRYWFNPTVAVEGIIFAWGEANDYFGVFTGRILYKLSDTPTVDFYIASGATFPFSAYGHSPVLFSAVGGIEFNFAFAKNLAWNVEFGGTISSTGNLAMALGTGIHFYF